MKSFKFVRALVSCRHNQQDVIVFYADITDPNDGEDDCRFITKTPAGEGEKWVKLHFPDLPVLVFHHPTAKDTYKGPAYSKQPNIGQSSPHYQKGHHRG